MAPSPENPGALNWALVTLLGVIWGGAFMGVRLALEGYGPFTVAAGRTLIAAVALVGAALIAGQRPLVLAPKGARRIAVVLAATSVAMPFLLLSWGQQHVPSALAGVTMGAVPLLVLPLVYLFSPDEGIGPRRIIGVILGFIGLMVLLAPEGFDGGSEFALLGGLACLGAAACYATSSVVTRRAKGIPPIPLAATTLTLASVLLVPAALLVEGVPEEIPLQPTLALTYVALFPTALAGIIRLRVITTAGSIFMSITSYQVPIWSVIFGLVFMGEDLPGTLFASLFLILAGIGISQSRQIQAAWRR